MRTTLRQVAEEANLSVTIVSQVLNGKPCRISDENRARVLEIAERLNYRRNLVAVSLVKGSTNTIGLAISDIRNDFFSMLAKGVEEECQNNDWNVMLCNSNDRHVNDMANLRMLADKGVSGIIFGMASDTTDEMAQECIDFMNREHIPYILVDRYIDTRRGGIVCVDHERGGFSAVEYLLRHGHRRILCITGPDHLIDSRQRYAGSLKALKKYDIPVDERLIIEGKYTFESGEKAIEEALDRQIDFDAVFAFNDMMAIGAMRKLRESGYRIPEDISVIGYDDIFMDTFLEKPLTTIRQPMEAIGRTAAQQIIEKLHSQMDGSRIIFEPELIERATVRTHGIGN